MRTMPANEEPARASGSSHGRKPDETLPPAGGTSVWARFVLCALFLLAASFGCSSAPSERDGVSVSSPYLMAVARDLLGADAAVHSLAGPGQCPGHFDVTPADVARVRRSQAFIRFDFQRHFDARIGAGGEPRIVAVALPGGMCEPTSYLAACRGVAEELVALGLLDRATADARLAAIEARMTSLEAQSDKTVKSAKLAGAKVVTTPHQAAFCESLGLNVVGLLDGNDDPAALAALAQAGREAGVRVVVGNVPQGEQAPRRLAEVLNVPAVMFDNFPACPSGDTSGGGPPFDELVLGNVRRLADACRRP